MKNSFMEKAKALVKEYDIVGLTEAQLGVVAKCLERDGEATVRRLIELGIDMDK